MSGQMKPVRVMITVLEKHSTVQKEEGKPSLPYICVHIHRWPQTTETSAHSKGLS